MFLVLIGSVARNEQHQNSDIDICRIENNCFVQKRESWPNGPINYIDYSHQDFMKLYRNGSLFIYHVINEGMLIRGDKVKWENLKDKFEFVDNYDGEISNIKEILDEFLNVEIYGKTFLTLYSNMFILTKNLAIYSLAQNGVFQFNKRIAHVNCFGDKYYGLLSESYNIFERGCVNPLDAYDFSCELLARDVVSYFRRKLEDF